MVKKVLVLGGQGRIGSRVAQDIATHTNAEVIVTGRTQKNLDTNNFLALDLTDVAALKEAIAPCALVVHCAGPFHYRDGRVLKICLEEGVNYIDVSDHRSFYEQVVKYREETIKTGVTAILNTGIFSGYF